MPLTDTGEGLIQILPVLVALARARQTAAHIPRLLCLEEPESHLHPRLHRALAEQMCRAVAGENPPTVVVETHSENLMLRVQIAIAKGEIAADRVIAYWIRQTEDGRSWADRVTFDSLGQPSGKWPPMVFAEDLRLAQELFDVQAPKLEGRPANDAGE